MGNDQELELGPIWKREIYKICSLFYRDFRVLQIHIYIYIYIYSLSGRKNEIYWVFRSDHVTLAFTASERRYCKNSLMSLALERCRLTTTATAQCP